MSTYTQILYQIVFGTKNRKKTLEIDKNEELFKYINGIIKNKNCHLYIINGTEDHIHILTHIHPTVNLSNFVKDIKIASSVYIKKENLFKNFIGWQDGYGAFTYSIKEKNNLVNYISNQQEHHKTKNFKEEYLGLLKEHVVSFDEKYLL
jgi:REP element-mobilizing transposase RayT